MERRRRGSRPTRRLVTRARRQPADTAALKDPARVALLLVRACASVSDTNGGGGGRDDGGDATDPQPADEAAAAVTPHPQLSGDDEEDDAERLEEENDDDDDDVADENAADDDDDDDDDRDSGRDAAGAQNGGDADGEDEPLGVREDTDDDVDAIAAALALAMQVVEQLKRRLLAKSAGESAEEEGGGGAECSSSVANSAAAEPTSRPSSLIAGASVRSVASSYAPGEAGVPSVHARAVSNSHCKHCNKSFNAFHRSRNCTSCGYSFCVKCVSRRQILPSSFGFKDEAVRVCELCCLWFQKALEQVFDTMEPPRTPTSREPSIAARHSSIGERTSVGGPASPHVRSGTNDEGETSEEAPVKLRRRQSRHSISVPSTQKGTSKAWFSGHLRAMHVGDRLPRKKTRTDTDLGGGEGESEHDAKPALVTRNLDSSGMASIPRRIERHDREQRASKDDANGCLLNGQQHGESSNSTNGGDDTHGADDGEGVFQMEPVVLTSLKPVSAETTPANADDEESEETRERRLRMRASKRSKFSRSASFDFTNLQSAASPSSASTATLNEGMRDISETSSSPSGPESAERASMLPRQKCFDDSDIVDSRAKTDVSGEDAKNHLPATVLRFAVYKIEASESQSLRRTLGFGKANPVLDRYSLELDCSQGIVRVKSVFMHRFWSFHCDAVRNLSFGSSSGTAKLVVHNGVEGNLTHELKFANDDEREQFKRAVETCRSSNLQAMRRASVGSSLASSPPLDPAVLLGSPVPDDLVDALAQSESSPEATVSNGDAFGLSLLPGELVVNGTEFPATLLIGPGGDNNEVSHAWGRIRGSVLVTNFRVAFVPSDHCYMPLRNAIKGSAAYIPLFAITFVQILYPGGRRSKASRAYSTGQPAIVVLNCKDVRVMRVQLEGPPHVSDERSQYLLNTISKLSDDSQRIKVAERGSPEAMTLPGMVAPFLNLPMGITVSSSSASESAIETSTFVRGEEETPPATTARKFIGPSSAPSPVLRPISPPQAMPLELSGSFAFSYGVECVSPDMDGWNLYADEREFRRQINGDPSAQPFFKFYQNARGNICKTYPSKLLLPASMNSATLTKVTEFRSKNRLPVITYYHRRNRCVLTRSSQPLLGNLLSGSSSLSDQLLVGVYRRLPDIIRNQSLSSASSRPIYIFDARKLKASTGNRLMGKGGVETPQDYPGAVIHHLNIANMYRMQSSFLSLMKLLLPGATDDSDKTWLMRVESTRWLNHMHYVLEGATKIARVLELEGSSVLVHCSDGWDRTAQLTALAQLMIDPYFRTIRGFAVLVEKDWCAFGHKFAERLGADRNKDPQRSKSSPVMLQFLDAVWQIQRQFPSAFEFNERFLLHVANSLTSGLYGTFLYDSRLQRDVNDVRSNSVSVWTPVLTNPSVFTNGEFVAREKPIWPWTGAQILRIWEGYFLQWHPKYYNCHWISSASSSSTTGAVPNSEYASPQSNIRAELSAAIVAAAAPLPSVSASESQPRDGSFDASGGGVVVTNLPSPVQDTAPRSNPSSVRSVGRASSSSRPQSVPKLPVRNVFIYRS